mmetsp:Transcript_9723/g.11079  ORF Transcript_9723/g.11079 Transcript_9723/m.11079 type:complete len:297 (-) Transcript_9723:127-1017(-)
MSDVPMLGDEEKYLREALGRIAYLLNKSGEEKPDLPQRKQQKPKTVGKCENCSKSILDSQPHYNTDDRLYHKDCFNCGVCNVPISGKHYFLEGTLHCEKDFKKYYQPVCGRSGCQKRIEDDLFVRARTGKYHAECFTCSMCALPLASIDNGKLIQQNFVIRNKKPYCIEHGVQVDGRVCFSCEQPITDTKAYETVSRSGQLLDLHTKCFTCHTCGISIENQEEISYLLKDNKIFCAKHGNRTCNSCSRPIANAKGHTEIAGQKYHPECTPKCTVCNNTVKSNVTHVDGGLVCSNCQ